MVSDKKVQELVIGELSEYRALKVKFENLCERNELGASDLFPNLREYPFGELKVKQIDRALSRSLDHHERKIIEMKYLSDQELKDLTIYLEIGLKKNMYYKKKRAALQKLAISLGII